MLGCHGGGDYSQGFIALYHSLLSFHMKYPDCHLMELSLRFAFVSLLHVHFCRT